MLKYKFKDKIIRISDTTAYRLDKGYPKEVSTEVEDFSEENKALAFKSDSSNEVYIVIPCGIRPSIMYDNDRFEWNGFELIKKVDYRDFERKEWLW